MLTLAEQLGQVLIVGIDGNRWDNSTEEFLSQIRPGGVIFFQRNIATASEFRELVGRVWEFLHSPPFLALDLEGGQVDRLRDVVAALPAVSDVARAGLGEQLGSLAGRELAAFSLNVDFAPVLDLGSAESKMVMGSRTAGASPREVIQFAESFLKGLGQSGVIGCGKHFPGLGSGQTDSHKALPVVEKAEREMWEQDLQPFRALASILPMIMVAHVHCPGLEKAYGSVGQNETSERLPATLSSAIVSRLLKERMEYKGLVLSDDLEMGGVLEGRSMEQAGVSALRAGCDVLLLCGPTTNTKKVFDAILQQAKSDADLRRLIERAAEKVLLAKTKLGVTRPSRDRKGAFTQSHSAPDFDTLRRQIADFSAAVRRKLEPTSTTPPAVPEEGSTR